MERASGIILPLFSLPSPYGVGTLGKAARETVLERYDRDDCLRRQLNLIYGVMK